MFAKNKLATLLLGASALAFLAGPATAGGFIQTLGLSQRTSSLAGAVTAKSQDFDAFYTNPAGAADFNTPLVGLTAKIIDTSNIEIPFQALLPTDDLRGGDVIDTIQGDKIAIAPATGAYLPMIPGSVVAGLGIGAPFALAADFQDQAYGTIRSNESSADTELLYIEASPTIAVKLTDRINVGATLNIGIAKHAKFTLRSDNVAGANIQTRFALQSDDDLPLPVMPWEFSTDPTAITFTLGTQVKLTDTLKFGFVYREETPNQFEGTLNVWAQDSGGLAGANASLCTGPTESAVCTFNFGVERVRADLELPRHIQFGFEWWAMPNWALSFDAQWTNWADATGFGSPLIVQLVSTQSVNAATNSIVGVVPGATTQVGVGGITNALSFLTGGAVPVGANQVFVNYDAHDTWSFMVGSEYALNDTWTILSGYQYDQGMRDKDSRDYLLGTDSDKHYVTGGVEYTTASPFGELKLNLGGQVIFYESENVGIDQSLTAGGVGPNLDIGGFSAGPNPINAATAAPNQIGFGNNEFSFEHMDGYIWTIGAGATLRFGAGG